MIRTVVIDDDPQMQELNCSLLKDNFSELAIEGVADSVEDGVRLIQEINPQLVLLDIEIKGGTGFHILQELAPYQFKVVFITAFNDFAIKAIKFSAIDYILKPVNEVEFCLAIKNAISLIDSQTDTQEQTHFFLDLYKKEMQSKKIVLRTGEAFHIVDISDIMFCKSDNSYTTFYMEDGEEVIVSKGIREYDGLLKEFGFFRPHQSYLVNLNHAKKVDKSDGGFVVMKNKKEIPVSVRQKKSLIRLLEEL